MFWQIFISPQVKRNAIISYKHGIYELPQKLSNNLRLKKLENNTDGVDSAGARAAQSWKMAWVERAQKKNARVAWAHKTLVQVKIKWQGSVGRNFVVGLRCLVEKVLLKILQHLQENTCAGVSC